MTTYWLSSLKTEPFEVPSELPADTDTVIVGGGLMGVATAYWLARLGTSVLLLERTELCWGASGRNAGLMLPSSSALEEPGLLEEVLATEGIQAGYATPGHLALASSESTWEAFRVEAERSREVGGPLEAMDRQACEELLGTRLSDRFLGGRWFPLGSVVHSARLVYGLARAAVTHGAVLAVQTEALELRHDSATGGLQVVTNRGSVEARHVVYACGSETPRLVPGLQGVLQPTVAQVLATEPLSPTFRVGLGMDWGSVFWRQLSDGAIVLGGGSRPLARNGAGEADLDPEIQSRLEDFLSSSFPDLPEFAIDLRWVGVMDNTRDGRPIVGPLASDPRQWLVVGFGGHGMPGGLRVGQGIAEGLTSGKVSDALVPLTPSRFAELN